MRTVRITTYLEPIAAIPVTAPTDPRPGSIRIHDSSIGIWEEGVNEKEFQRRVFGPLIRFLRDDGWSVRVDQKTKKHYRLLSPRTRRCRFGDLEAMLELRGRHISFEMFQSVANRNGGRGGFDKLERMPFLLRMRCIATMRKVTTFLRARHGYSVELPSATSLELQPGGMTAPQFVAAKNAEDKWRFKQELGRAAWGGDYDRKSADGVLLEHGQPVYLLDRAGRWLRGTAFYNINNIWWVATGPYSVISKSCSELRTTPPENLRRKANQHERRHRLERELSKATTSMDFQRAALLKGILFGDQPLYRIWAKDKEAWYRACARGYTSDAAQAGLYTEDEARRQVGSSNELTMVPAGNKPSRLRRAA
ncbi:hypothetical protein [Azospirillum tabaci]|uniref:hypothetical protein n=1 Tax=Azospirillum tabaci TaxID=2752310 RepID=UPI001B3BF414|nr:hypothetical protein [Azospirillum tabaci]